MRYLALLCLVLAGCGTTTDRQTKTVEVETFKSGPVVVDSPVGQFTVQPAQFQRLATTDETEQRKTSLDMPEVPALLSAAASGTPWGMLVGLAGTALAAFAGKKALDAGRHRNELIDGVERSKDKLPPAAWETLTAALEAEQSKDTKQVIKKRVG